jgi:hypothetical protein
MRVHQELEEMVELVLFLHCQERQLIIQVVVVELQEMQPTLQISALEV